MPKGAKAPIRPVHLVAFTYNRRDDKIRKQTVGRCYPLPEQVVLAENLCRLLNLQVARDGSWRVIWTQPVESSYDRFSGMYKIKVPKLLEMHWLDRDDDVIFVVESDDDVWTLLDIGISHLVEHCEEAYHKAMDQLRAVEISAAQTFKQAKGERLNHPLEEPADIA